MKKTNGRIFNYKKDLFIMLIVLILSMGNTVKAEVVNHLWGDFDLSGIYTDNVYGTSDSYGDYGLNTNAKVGLRTKFSKYTFTRLSYQFKLKNFFTENIENNSVNMGDFLVRQRIGEIGTVDINGGIEQTRYPNITIDKYQITQNSNRTFILPSLKIYPIESTSIEIGGDYDSNVFADYDLDSIRKGASASIGQEISVYTYFKVGAAYDISDYSERYVYGINGSTRTNTNELRIDNNKSLFVNMSQYISPIKGNIVINYAMNEFTSNGNYFDYGPGQWEIWKDGDITGDERLVDSYYSYISRILDVNGDIALSGSMKFKYDVLYGLKDYEGRLVKDVNDQFISPDTTRKDTPLFIKLELNKDLTEILNMNFGRAEMSIIYTYENNQSNDYMYNYTSQAINLLVKYYFSR